MASSEDSQSAIPATQSATNVYSSDMVPLSVSVPGSAASFPASPQRQSVQDVIPSADGATPAASTTAAEVAALDASAAANAIETEAALRRTTQTAHQTLQTAQLVTTQLATQGEGISTVEEALRVNEEEWHRGRKEVRRTRHWYVAFAHWLRCGGSATFRGVATKEDQKGKGAGSRLLKAAPRDELVAGRCSGGTAMHSDEPLKGEHSSLARYSASAAGGAASLRSTRSNSMIVPTPSADVSPAMQNNAVVPLQRDGAAGVTTTPTSKSAGVQTAARLRGTLGSNARPSQRADMELCDRLDPGLEEVRTIVKEIHEQALLHNEMLTAHIDRLDSASQQAGKTVKKNEKALQQF